MRPSRPAKRLLVVTIRTPRAGRGISSVRAWSCTTSFKERFYRFGRYSTSSSFSPLPACFGDVWVLAVLEQEGSGEGPLPGLQATNSP